MKKRTITRKDILFFFISTFVLTVAWVGFNLYHTWVTSTITPELQMNILPIDPAFDTTTLTQLKQRKNVAPLYEISSQTPSATNTAGQQEEEATILQQESAATQEAAIEVGIQGQ